MPVLGWRKMRRQLIHIHRKRFGGVPELVHPLGFNERIMQRMIHDRDPWLRIVGDKLATRAFVARMAGPGFAMPLLGSWKRAKDIDWKALPKRFVLKPNNMSGKVRMVRNPSSTEISSLTALAATWLRQSYFDAGLEWSYLNTPDRVLAEPLIESHDGGSLIEVNVMTFAGQPVQYEVMTGRKGTKLRCNGWFDSQGRRLSTRGKAEPPEAVLDPAGLLRLNREFEAHRDAIAELAHRLGCWFAMMRVDIWITSQGLKVAELTAYPQRGTTPFQPATWNHALGAMFANAVRSDVAQPWRQRTSWPADLPSPPQARITTLKLRRFATYLRHWRPPTMPSRPV